MPEVRVESGQNWTETAGFYRFSHGHLAAVAFSICAPAQMLSSGFCRMMEGSLHFPALTRKNLLPPQDSSLSETFSLWSPMSSPTGQLHLHGSMAAPSIHPRYAGILPPQHSPWPPLAKFDSFQSNLIPLLTRVHALLTPLLGLL